ncbi:ABC transporter ATP-binding protein [Bdellovibrio svalbardensis]|uniref:ABC transporter ATP-binding protein/permease n=1 Tax=Bdellovibrio svalbardensis TaxID=2972972 RepID=A0ABT6DE14_9BACT|nr:ABC transporter ATP-binding protein [Bdellovibrio svalbardensis]MDG0815070.1 ABC transporter ATP-binding protein/permease [Bdellovibrio svalbardensis]
MVTEIKRLLSEAKPYKKTIVIVAVAGVIHAAASARMALLIKPLFDNLAKAEFDLVLQLVPWAMLLAVIAGVARYFHIYLMNYVAECITQALRQKLQQKFMKLNLSFHNTYATGSGGLISLILNDIGAIQDGLRMVADIFLHPLLFIFLLGNLLIIDWKLTLATMILVPIIGAFLKSTSRSLRKYTPIGQTLLQKMTSTIKESIDGVRIIQSFNLEKVMGNRLINESKEYLETRKIVHARTEIMGPVTEILASAIVMGVLLYETWEVKAGRATPGTFVGFIASLLMLNAPIKKFQESYVRIQSVVAVAKRIFHVLDDPNEVPESIENKPFPQQWNKITYKNVSFSYGREMILKNVDLEIKRGEIVALVGASGSGKSTIVNLLERFFDSTSGEILFDDVNIRDIELTELRRNIALVTQDVFLFSDTIENNIGAGNLSRDKKDVVKMATLANANDFIMKMPNGYQSRVGDRGNLLSGGEKQRVSIARAMFKDAPLLILDEATSALDTASEIEVQKGLDHLMEGRTALVIAHRLSTIQKADKIVVLKGGQIVEIGTHHELLKNEGEYHRFHSLQHS